jgi:hypothetical protein
MIVDKQIENKDMREYHDRFTVVTDKIARKCPNARLIPGIIRGSINRTNSLSGIEDRAFFTIASGLNIDRYIGKLSKIRDIAIGKAIIFNEQEKNKRHIVHSFCCRKQRCKNGIFTR